MRFHFPNFSHDDNCSNQPIFDIEKMCASTVNLSLTFFVWHFYAGRAFYEVSFLFMSECFDLPFSSHCFASGLETLEIGDAVWFVHLCIAGSPSLRMRDESVGRVV